MNCYVVTINSPKDPTKTATLDSKNLEQNHFLWNDIWTWNFSLKLQKSSLHSCQHFIKWFPIKIDLNRNLCITFNTDRSTENRREKRSCLKHGAILYNEAEVFSLSIRNPTGRPMLPFDWLIHSGLILAHCHKILESDGWNFPFSFYK